MTGCVCILAVAAAAAAAAAAACPLSDSAQFQLAVGLVPGADSAAGLAGADFAGGDTLSACLAGCLSTWSCKAVTFNTPGSRSGSTTWPDPMRCTVHMAAVASSADLIGSLDGAGRRSTWVRRQQRCGAACPARALVSRLTRVPSTRPKYGSAWVAVVEPSLGVEACAEACDELYSCRSFTWRNATLAAPAPQCKMYATMYKNQKYQVSSDVKDFYFFDSCVEACSGPPPANATERFTRVPQKVPKYANGYIAEVQLQLSDPAARMPESDADACAQACIERGEFICAGFTFLANVTRLNYGQCRLYRSAYSLRYLKDSAAKDFHALRKPCHALTILVEPGAAPIVLPADGSRQWVQLAVSGPHELLRLTRRYIDTGRTALVGRSYDGHPWETAPVETQFTLPSDCGADTNDTDDSAASWYPVYRTAGADGSANGSVCVLRLPAVDEASGRAVEYRLEVADASGSLPDARSAAARFLIRTTFGPTTADIAEYVAIHGSDPSAWLAHQMDTVPPTLLRAYFRRRSNPRYPSTYYVDGGPAVPFTELVRAGTRRGACSVGSRWTRFAFNADDLGKVIEFSPAATSSHTLSTQGHLRTVVADGNLAAVTMNPGEQRRSYSATWMDAAPGAEYARSMLDTDGTWVANADPTLDAAGVWLQLDLGRELLVTGVVTQGPHESGTEASGIGSFRVMHSTDGQAFTDINQNFVGSADGSKSTAVFTSPVSTRHIRVVVQTWQGVISFRAGVLIDARSLSSSVLTVCDVEEWVGGAVTATLEPHCEEPRSIYEPGAVPSMHAWGVPPALPTRALRPDTITLQNPPVAFVPGAGPASQRIVAQLSSPISLTALRWHADPARDNSFVLAADTVPTDELRCSANTPTRGPLFAAVAVGSTQEMYMLDPRIELAENSLEEPEQGAAHSVRGYRRCNVAPKTFVNAQSCVIGGSNCMERVYSSAEFELNATMILRLYERGGRHIHRIEGLRLDAGSPSPCAGGQPSRWIRREPAGLSDCDNVGAQISPAAQDTIAAAIEAASSSGNLWVRDVLIDNAGCLDVAAGAAVFVGGSECWVQAHPHEFNVYDFTEWALHAHPGNAVAAAAGHRNPISRWAWDGQFSIVFPSMHSMSRWTSSVAGLANEMNLLGRFGDVVDFLELPLGMHTDDVAQLAGATSTSVSAGGDETCGSPGEVANDPNHGHTFLFNVGNGQKMAALSMQVVDRDVPNDNPKPTPTSVRSKTMQNIALNGPDQLRQRMAWALSQILVVNSGSLGFMRNSEQLFMYHDILVRHAFGSYRDIMREVSYSPVMGVMLTYLRSQSLASSGFQPDENYAREIMQLFSIGLWELHNNGTMLTDANGHVVPTYDQDVVVTMSRAWTGFELQGSRGNIEHDAPLWRRNYHDPMQIWMSWRDTFPKRGLRGRYVGDGAPLCIDLPERAFLRRGATYWYLGAEPNPTKHDEPSRFSTTDTPDVARVALDAHDSGLYTQLCQPDSGTGDCRLSGETVLQDTVPCHGEECLVDTVRVVKLANAGHRSNGDNYDVYFEYIRRPCVELAFSAASVVLAPKSGLQEVEEMPEQPYPMCGEPRATLGSTACCGNTDQGAPSSTDALCAHAYSNERVTLATATSRCSAQGKQLCSLAVLSVGLDPAVPECELGGYFWSQPEACVQAVQIDRNGQIRMVDRVPGYQGRTAHAPDSLDLFTVLWADGTFPLVDEAASCPGECEAHGRTCICNVDVTVGPVFVGEDSIPSRDAIVSGLRVGAEDPALFDDGRYAKCMTPECILHQPDVEVYSLSNDPAASGAVGDGSHLELSKDTVFAVADGSASNGRLFFRNVESTVTIAGGSDGDGFSFRNPPSFYSRGARSDVRDGEHETDAVIDHYFQHPSTPPFVAKALLQRMVTSNPSPRYVESVATAFQIGAYGGFGTGVRGDLAAVTAAIFLDREALSATMDQDGVHGGMREPFLKLLHLLRSLEIGTAPDSQLVEFDTAPIEQRIFGAPSVFSFFQGDYVPDGALKSSGLISPEAMVFTSPATISYLNAIAATVKSGLTSCNGGLGPSPARRPIPGCHALNAIGSSDLTSWTFGNLTWSPPPSAPVGTSAAVVRALDVLLTGGRLRSHSRAVIEDAHTQALAETGSATVSLQIAEQLLVVSPEFQLTAGEPEVTSNPPANPSSGISGPVPGSSAASGGNDPVPYKALVSIVLGGGADSFNMLVPLDGCASGASTGVTFDEYAAARGSVGLLKDVLLPVQVPPGMQPCTTFGLHPELATVQGLYADGDALWVANAGMLDQPLGGAEYRAKTVPFPRDLFAHNRQMGFLENLDVRRIGTERSDGVLGRVVDALVAAGHRTGAYSVGLGSKALRSAASGTYDIVGSDGVTSVHPRHEPLLPTIAKLLNRTSGSPFAETWSGVLRTSINRSTVLRDALSGVLPDPAPCWEALGSNSLAKELKQVAMLIAAAGSVFHNERDVFTVGLGGFDVHNYALGRTAQLLRKLDGALGCFMEEMKRQNLWHNVTIVQSSEFGRSLRSNGDGTDHAWGGNYFVAGGAVKGGQILGEFPDLRDDAPQSIGHGRLVPTTSWEHIYNAVGSWIGLDSAAIDEVLPNRGAFEGSLFEADTLFDPEFGGGGSCTGCSP